MRRSTNRILTTHVGSLPRPPELIDVLLAAGDAGAPAPRDFEDKLKRAVNEVVQKQVDLGVDVVDDGEFSKRGFAVYSHERLDGLTPSGKARPSNWAGSREALDFPAFRLLGIEQPVVQAVSASLPELDGFGQYAVAAPVQRPRRIFAVA